jgi:hypothetical protein
VSLLVLPSVLQLEFQSEWQLGWSMVSLLLVKQMALESAIAFG